jgi:alkylation response protein AidB-like acyl-CoA dehydrogenase
MKLLRQPGNEHLNGPPSPPALAFAVLDVPSAFVALDEGVAAEAASIGARCFLEMWPVSAASEANVAESQDCQEHLVTPLTRWTAFRCFLRSVAEAKDAPHTVPQGMSH